MMSFFSRVLLFVAPDAEPFEVLWSVVHVVAVLVMNLALARFAAPDTWAFWAESASKLTCSRASLGFPVWIKSLGFALAGWAAVGHGLERVPCFGPDHSARIVLPPGSKWLLANGANLGCLHRVRVGHFS